MSKDTTWLLRYRVPLLLVIAAVTVALTSQLGGLRFDFSPQQLFETAEHDEAWMFYEETVETFGRDDATLFVLLNAGEDGSALTSPHRTWLTSITEHFGEVEGIEATTALTTAITVRTNSGGDLEVLPAGELETVEILADPLLTGSLVSTDGDLAVALIDFDESRRDIDALTVAVEEVRAWIDANPAPAGSTVEIGGIPAVRVDAVDAMRAEQLRFAPLSACIVCLLLWFALRRVSRVVFALLTVTLAIAWTMSLMVIAGIAVDVLNSVLPTLLLVIGISDGLHLMVRDQQEHRAGRTRSRALTIAVRTLAVACLLTSFTTAVGFASLGASSTLILVRFGVLVAIGVMVTYLLTLGVLPQLISLAPPPSQKASEMQFARNIALYCGGFALRRPKLTAAVGLIAAVSLAVVGFSRVDVSVRLTDLYQEDHPVSVLQRTIDERLGGVLAMSVIVTLPDADGHRAPEVIARLAKMQRRIEGLYGVASTRSVADFVGAIHRGLAPDDPHGLPASRELLAQEWLVSEMSGELPLDPFVAEEGRRLRVLVRSKDLAGADGYSLSREIERIALEVFGDVDGVSIGVTGDAYIATRNLATLIRDLFTSLALASVVIFFILLVVFRSLRFALVGVVPNALPLVAVLGFMGITGMNLDVANVVIFSIALGLAVDDTIHVLARFREEQAAGGTVTQMLIRTLAGSGQAVVLTSIILGGGMSVLMLSDFVATSRFGGLTALSLAVALFADLMLLPAMLLLIYRRVPVARAVPTAAPTTMATAATAATAAPRSGS